MAGHKDGLLRTRLNLVSLDDYSNVAQSKIFCAFRCYLKR